jgi:hypothetical protein
MFIINEYSMMEDDYGNYKRAELANTYEIDSLSLFVYDGCHKIYIVEDQDDIESVKQLWGEDTIFYNIDELQEVWDNSCSLRFISNWKLDKQYVRQFYDAEFDLF